MFKIDQYGLSRPKFALLLLFGVILWAVAAAILHYVGPKGAYDGAARVIMYALTLPGTWISLKLVQMIVKFDNSQFVIACSVMLLSATLVDGIVLAWLPWIYGNTASLVAGAGGSVLWGVGCVLLVAFFENKAQ